MPTDTGTAHFVRVIIEILDETFDTHHGLYLDKGTSMFETLATISAEDASRPVSASCASIAAQVNHTTYYLDMLGDAAQGKELADIDWNEAWTIGPVDDSEWTALVSELRRAANSTTSLFKSLESWDEDAAECAVAMAVHTAYHLGEIRQALCTIQNRQ
jgi:hypothetical protein